MSLGQIGYSYGHQQALTDAYSVKACTTVAEDARSLALPQKCVLDRIEVELASVVTGVSITAYLAHDAAGDRPASNPVTVTFAAGVTTAAKGGCVIELDELPYVQPDDGVDDTLYVVAKLNAGTATASFRIVWRR